MKNQDRDLEFLDHLKHLLVETVQKHNYNLGHVKVLDLSRQIDVLINALQQSYKYERKNN